MDYGIKGKVAMVAAGTKGIGLAAAKILAAEGARVCVCGRTEATFQDALKEIGENAMAVRCDVSNARDIEAWFHQTVEKLGIPQILVTNTGGPPAGAWSVITDEQWQTGFDSTLMNVVRMVRLVAPGMKEKGWGRIVHVTSLVAVEPNPLLPISSTLRSGLHALTKLQAAELGAHGVTVNCVLPGHTLTDRQRHLAEIRSERDGITPDEALKLQAQEIPLKRLADPDEIGHAIAFLSSNQAGFITGTHLLVDGGMTKGI